MAAPLAIELITTDERSVATKVQLERLLDSYDLSPWLYTRSVAIDADAIPHSHPVLTLHTRHLDDDRLLLSTFVHEQLHWFLTSPHMSPFRRPSMTSAPRFQMRRLDSPRPQTTRSPPTSI